MGSGTIALSQGVTLDELRRLATTRRTWGSSWPIIVQVRLILDSPLVENGRLAFLGPASPHQRCDVENRSGPSSVYWMGFNGAAHHTTEEEGLDKNFAGLFPFIDLAFGTFYMPPGRQPQRFGITNDDVPSGLVAQLAYPFRRK
jgi:hypothetical protein